MRGSNRCIVLRVFRLNNACAPKFDSLSLKNAVFAKVAHAVMREQMRMDSPRVVNQTLACSLVVFPSLLSF